MNRTSAPRLPIVLLAFSSLALASCASRADLEQVSKSQRQVRRLLANYTVALEEVRRKVDALQVDAGTGGVTAGGDAEQRRRLERLELRIAALESQAMTGAAPGAMPGAGAVPPPLPGEGMPVGQAPPGQVASAPPPPRVEDRFQVSLAAEEAAANDPAYRAAVDLVRQGQCRQAIPALRSFVRQNGKSAAADNAQYLIGNCYYQEKDYNRAIVELNEVLVKYPKGDKVPGALLLLGYSFADSGENIDARLILQKLVGDYPQSEEAQRGQQKLQQLSE